MNILFTRFPLESRFGGAEVQTLALMKGLQEHGHEVFFLGSCEVLLEETGKLRIENGELRIGPPPVTKFGTCSWIWRKFGMRKKLNSQFSILNSQFHFDAVVMLSLSEKLLLTPYIHKQGIKTIWIEHDRVGHWLTMNPWLPKLRKLSRLVTTVVVSDLSKSIYEDLGFWNVVAIPNGIDVARLTLNEKTNKPFDKAQDRRANAQTMFRIGTLARLSHDKGIDVLIDAVKDLLDVSLTIIGTGPEEKKLQTNKPKNQQTTILPHVDNLHDFYTGLDVFVLPSREHDPFGLVAGEAMMLGVPVIVTDACGISEYLTNGHDAVIVPAGSSEELRKAIRDLQRNSEKRLLMAAIGKWTAEEKFSMGKMVECYGEVLSEKRE